MNFLVSVLVGNHSFSGCYVFKCFTRTSCEKGVEGARGQKNVKGGGGKKKQEFIFSCVCSPTFCCVPAGSVCVYTG